MPDWHNGGVQAAAAGLSARRGRALALGALVIAVFSLSQSGGAMAVEVPPGYQLDQPIEAVQLPTAIAFAGGKVFVAERNGRVKAFDSIDDPEPELVLDIADNVHAVGDSGLLGMALDDDYPEDPYIYLSYTYDAPLGESAPVHEQDAAGNDNCVRRSGGEVEGEGDCVVSGRVTRVKLDPATGIALTGAGTPEEQELVRDWCQPYQSHSMGDLAFDRDGALLVSGGEGSNYAALDYGQFEDHCGDPEFEGGSLRSQDLNGRWNDPTGYSGTVLRIDPETGAALPTNPLFGGGDVAARRIVAYGLRNPFRLTVRPGTGELYIGDVGSLLFDEINLLPNPTSQPGGAVANFGWPCYEGFGRQSGFEGLADGVPLPICQRLYESIPGAPRPPYFAYPRAGSAFSGDECDPTSGAAVSGLAFYEEPASPSPSALPASLDGSLLYSDAARGCIWEIDRGPGGRPDTSDVRNLVWRGEGEDDIDFVPVNLTVGPKGALYIPNFWHGGVYRLRHFEGNRPPEARIAADPDPYGRFDKGGVFEVTLDGSESTDAEDDAEELDLTYEWDLDADGSFDDDVGQKVELEYTDPNEEPIVQLRVTDTGGAADVARITLYPGDLPPEVEMALPDADVEWIVGEEIELSGSATDPKGDADSDEPPRLDWEVFLRHCPDHCHSHPHAHIAGKVSATVVAPDHEYPSHLEAKLTATDSRGLSVSISREIYPKSVVVTMRSEPAGARLTIASTTQPAPFTETLLAGGSATISAPETVVIGERSYNFASWSDGGARAHLVSRTADDTLVARYLPEPSPAPVDLAPAALLASPAWLRFRTRPGGLPLRVGRRWRRSRFGVWLRPGRVVRLAAPRRLVRRGRVFTFSRWTDARRRVRRVGAVRSRAYVAVFNSRPLVRNGLAQALSWYRRAK